MALQLGDAVLHHQRTGTALYLCLQLSQAEGAALLGVLQGYDAIYEGKFGNLWPAVLAVLLKVVAYCAAVGKDAGISKPRR